MNFKRLKYNLIFMLMFVLVLGVFGFEIYQSILPADSTLPNNPGVADEDPSVDGPGDENDGGGTGEEDPGADDGQSEEDYDPYLSEHKRYANAIVTYALDKLYSSDGYKSTYTKTMTNDAGIMTVTQNITGTIDKSGDQSLEYLTFKADSNMGVSLIRAFYFDGDTVTQYQTASGNTTDFTSAKKEEMTKTDYFKKYILNLADKPILKFTSARITSSGKTKSGKDYTVIQATVDTASMNSSGYTKYYESSGDLTNVSAQSATYTFYIYDDTTQIFQIRGVENLTGKNPAFGVGVNVKIDYTQTFTSTNQKFEIQKP